LHLEQAVDHVTRRRLVDQRHQLLHDLVLSSSDLAPDTPLEIVNST
jgi:hypothetical protein